MDTEHYCTQWFG